MPWYAVYTKPRWEKKVAKLLTNQGIENYCPLHTVIKQWKDRKKKVELPLLTSYVFVNITDAEQAAVRLIDGVVNFVYWLKKPAVIKDNEIKQLKDFTNKHTSGILIEPLKETVGSKIVIKTGPFKDKIATIKTINKNTVELILESLGIRLVVEK